MNRAVSRQTPLGRKELMAEQGTGPIPDVSVLQGDFWPEEESIEEFYEWRGRERTDPVA